MKAIETTYNGHRFRSRLEARWAAMFDLLGWRWTYEPIDADGYIPDFLLHGDDPVIVEVKPDSSIKDLSEHVEYVIAGLTGHWSHDILILGMSPTPDHVAPVWSGNEHPPIGVLVERIDQRAQPEFDIEQFHGWGGGDGAGVWNRCGLCGIPTFVHEYQSYHCRLCGHGDGDHYMTGWWQDRADPNLNVLWGKAHEMTRWTPSR